MTPTPGARGSAAVRLSVCIVTFERPDFLKRCLAAVDEVEGGVHEIVVVDASKADGSGRLAQSTNPLHYVWAPQLAGWMTRSRNEALKWVMGDVVAFIDDDVVVTPGWAAALRRAFRDPSVAGVAGRTRNGLPGEETYDQPIGRLLPTGGLTEGFAAITDGPVEVDHGIGANMSFRREVLADLGGFRDDYPGTALREDTDMFLRVRRAGLRVVYDPEAVVDHRPAPHVKGARFDTRYKLYRRRNHLVLLARDQGLGSRAIRAWIRDEFGRVEDAGGGLRRAQRVGITALGVIWGVAAALRQASWRPTPPRREGAQADEIRERLGRPTPAGPSTR